MCLPDFSFTTYQQDKLCHNSDGKPMACDYGYEKADIACKPLICTKY